jgi:hypothetical protein
VEHLALLAFGGALLMAAGASFAIRRRVTR